MYITTVDIAHPPVSSDAAENILDEEVRSVRKSKDLRVIKIIHGYGSSKGRSVLKDMVKNWTYINRKYLKAVIPGEDYSIMDAKTMEMRKICGQVSDPDLDKGNQGITIIWIK